MLKSSSVTVIDNDTETCHQFIGCGDSVRQAEVEQVIKKALRQGHVVVRETGERVFQERVVRFNPNAETPGGRYEWSDDGNRMRADVIEHTTHRDGTKEQRHVRAVWVKG